MRFSKLALAIVLAVYLLKTVKSLERPNLEDFRVYETAALLVHEHRGALMYDGADTGEDPQLRFARPDSPFARAALSLGQRRVRLYVYPPLLADLMVPITWVSSTTAGRVWLLVNILALITICALTLRLMHVPWRSFAGLIILLSAFTFYPVIDCLIWGQITIVLLLLWTGGIYFYVRGWKAASAAAFALATAIKLTPLIVVAPLFLWSEWKWLRDYAVALLVCVGLTCLINTPGSLPHYFMHVMPSMSAGVASFDNKSLLASVQISYLSWESTRLHQAITVIPHSVMMTGKLLALACTFVAVALVFRFRSVTRETDRIITLALFAMLSAAISPVSWKHAYVVCFLGLCCLWIEAIQERLPAAYVTFLGLCSLELGWSVFGLFTSGRTHGVGIASWVTPAAVVLLVFYRLGMNGSVHRRTAKAPLVAQAA